MAEDQHQVGPSLAGAQGVWPAEQEGTGITPRMPAGRRLGRSQQRYLPARTLRPRDSDVCGNEEQQASQSPVPASASCAVGRATPQDHGNHSRVWWKNAHERRKLGGGTK